MNKIVIEPHYLGCIAYYMAIVGNDVRFEINQHYTKQTYKNRCNILTSQGARSLTVPVRYTNRTLLKDVQIDHSQSWIREHWGAIYSSYGKAPYFEFLGDQIQLIYSRKHKFLIDLNMEMMTFCLKVLKSDIEKSFSENYEQPVKDAFIDVREQILPKRTSSFENDAERIVYPQAFGSKFVANLSIIDLIMNEGGNSGNLLKG